MAIQNPKSKIPTNESPQVHLRPHVPSEPNPTDIGDGTRCEDVDGGCREEPGLEDELASVPEMHDDNVVQETVLRRSSRSQREPDCLEVNWK